MKTTSADFLLDELDLRLRATGYEVQIFMTPEGWQVCAPIDSSSTYAVELATSLPVALRNMLRNLEARPKLRAAPRNLSLKDLDLDL